MRVFIIVHVTPRRGGSCFATRELPAAPTGPSSRPITLTRWPVLLDEHVGRADRLSEADDSAVAFVAVVVASRLAQQGTEGVQSEQSRNNRFRTTTVRIFTHSVIANTYTRFVYGKNVRLAEKGRSRTQRSPRESLGSSTSCSSYSLVFRLRSDYALTARPCAAACRLTTFGRADSACFRYSPKAFSPFATMSFRLMA